MDIIIEYNNIWESAGNFFYPSLRMLESKGGDGEHLWFLAEWSEIVHAGGPDGPRVPRGSAFPHHTRTGINTWPYAIYGV